MSNGGCQRLRGVIGCALARSRTCADNSCGVSSDALLGVVPLPEETSPKTARLLKRLRRVEKLPAADQRAVLTLVDALLEKRGVA